MDWGVFFRNALDQIHVTLESNRLGHAVVPGFPVEERGLSDSLATELYRRTQRLETQTCGWVVDLRTNTGGNMWPMLSGLSAFLGDGTVGYFTGNDDQDVPWVVEDGSAKLDTMILASVDDVDVALSSSPVAVLIGPRTGSSGEALAIAFRGRNHTQHFGQPTAGATSSPTRIRLEDGAVIGFAEVFFADRNRIIYRGPVEPDVLIESSLSPDEDPVLDSAREWLTGQGDCSAK
jgi:C-terminal processing protease CtpA/Prc